jgi:hypothetical protein
MKKISKEVNLLDISQVEHRTVRADKIKTTDVNILLNRVRMSKKTELRKKIIFISLLLFAITLVSVFSLI